MNDFLGNGFCEDELNRGECMFDGLDCCGFDESNDGDYDDKWDIAPGDTALCTSVCAKVCTILRSNELVLKKTTKVFTS